MRFIIVSGTKNMAKQKCPKRLNPTPYARFGGQQEYSMTKLREFDERHMNQLRQAAADGKNKTQAADEIGFTLDRLRAVARRTGYEAEINRLFGRKNAKLVVDDALMEKCRELSKTMGMRDACTYLRTTPQTMRRECAEVGRLLEFCDIFPLIRNRSVEARVATLPRELDPAVKWLTREWRRAA